MSGKHIRGNKGPIDQHANDVCFASLSYPLVLRTPDYAWWRPGGEYGFRGYLMLASGSLFLSRVAAIVITSLLFALAHGTQNLPLFFDRFAFGLMAGLAVVLIGGLEARDGAYPRSLCRDLCALAVE